MNYAVVLNAEKVEIKNLGNSAIRTHAKTMTRRRDTPLTTVVHDAVAGDALQCVVNQFSGTLPSLAQYHGTY